MDTTFFRAPINCKASEFRDIPEEAILVGGLFSKAHVADMLSCANCKPTNTDANLWQLPIEFSSYLADSNDEALKWDGVKWSELESWSGTDINSMDLAGHLLELKHSYLTSESNGNYIWCLFE